jgi:2-oxoglutarate dehydrogenase E1 component
MVSMNSAYVEDLYLQFLRSPDSIADDWRQYFEAHSHELAAEFGLVSSNSTPNGSSNGASNYTNGAASALVGASVPATPAAVQTPTPAPQAVPTPSAPARAEPKIALGPLDALETLTGVPERIVINMESSLHLPVATTVRTIPIKVLEENREVINNAQARRRRKKLSFTHIIAWAIVRALMKYPAMNHAFARVDGKPTRIKRGSINMGLAVDMTRKDGSRGLVVPSVKDAQNMTFKEFMDAYDTLIAKSKVNKLDVNDLSGTTASLTNPGGFGTNASIPRLMEGQGLIIAAGSIDYPAELKAVSPSVISTLAVSKVMTLTSTYDHRIIQGAESGEFLRYMEELLKGGDQFYDQIFASLGVPFEPYKWSVDTTNPFVTGDTEEVLEAETKAVQLINAYRVRGHFYADMNPLGLQAYYYPELEMSYYGFTIWDLGRELDTGGLGGMKRAPLRDIIKMLRDTYCSKIGVEFMHIRNTDKKNWVKEKFETVYNRYQYTKPEKMRVLRKLVEAETFEKFIHTKFVGSKRFSVEGGEVFIPAIDKILDFAVENGVESVFMGMAHRGRLNTLINIMGKSASKMFKKFKNELDPEAYQGSGDVKYHLGAVGKYKHPETGKELTVELAPNPSHLEAVNPVVVGMARARLDQTKDKSFSKALPILIHGDSAVAGLGIVQETLNLANLRGYTAGGTIHIVINNQIGFTTVPEDARSTTYCTDIGKMLGCPILHVNGDDPEAVLTAAAFAIEYRMKFGEDVFIDIYCYRKYGHNEADEPAYTQPLLYKKIKNLPAASELYLKHLLDEKMATKEEADAIVAEINTRWNQAYDESSTVQVAAPVVAVPIDVFAKVETAISPDMVREIAEKVSIAPQGFTVHPKLQDLLKRRGEMISQDKGCDWGMGEALAFGSLVLEGSPVRITGEDAARGTFSHRHAVLTDYETERDITLLNKLSPTQAPFMIYDSALSEFAVLGFEYGYSVTRPQGLTVWEGQFGDFANGAATIIDQFIASGEAKWNQTSGLVMLLPHGYEGQGPEHSSARLERFLQLCAEDNMIVGNFTTPAQLFHALRRQVKRSFKKPLVLMTPKSMLRNPQAVSHVADFTSGTFQEVIDDTSLNASNVRRVLFCTGKVYYDLVGKRAKLGADDVAILRLEQIYPFHEARIRELLNKYQSAKDVVWVQEEPKNMGAWSFVQPLLSELLLFSQRLNYAGRRASASPATGFALVHNAEQEALLDAAFGQF